MKFSEKIIIAFTKHPEDSGETYFQHFLFTCFMAFRIIFCGIIILLHGIFPFIFTKTASSQIERIYLILKKRIPKERREEIDWEI